MWDCLLGYYQPEGAPNKPVRPVPLKYALHWFANAARWVFVKFECAPFHVQSVEHEKMCRLVLPGAYPSPGLHAAPQDIGVQSTFFLCQCFAQLVQICVVVCFGEETRFTVVAALDDVQRDAIKMDAGAAGHGFTLRLVRN